jgi:ribosomal protein L32
MKIKAEKNLKCAKCGHVILEGETCKCIDNIMWYHVECYDGD